MQKTAAEIIASLKDYEEQLGENFIPLMEDIADSVVEVQPTPEPDYSGYVTKEAYDELKAKYVERFMGITPTGEPNIVPNDEPEEEEISIEDIIKAYAYR